MDNIGEELGVWALVRDSGIGKEFREELVEARYLRIPNVSPNRILDSRYFHSVAFGFLQRLVAGLDAKR